jgi:uncharacterized Fe-S cluster protein YjdI
MSQWVIKGLKTGIKTTHYPGAHEHAPGVSPGLPQGGGFQGEALQEIVARCPTHALQCVGDEIAVDYRRCVHCYRCVRGTNPPMNWQAGYEWAAAVPDASRSDNRFGRAFRGSLHILVVDAGDCCSAWRWA